MQLTADVHETELSMFDCVFGGFGEGCIVHVAPSQRCTRLVPEYERAPTAVHARRDVHDTPDSVLSRAWAPSGVGSTVQLVPFHPSASGDSSCRYWDPTAVHARADTHDTSASAVPVTPATAAVASSNQPRP